MKQFTVTMRNRTGHVIEYGIGWYDSQKRTFAVYPDNGDDAKFCASGQSPNAALAAFLAAYAAEYEICFHQFDK